MSQYGSLTYYSGRTILLIFFILFGLISSRALISIGTGLLALNLILSTKEHQWRFVKKNNFAILAAVLFFVISLLFVLIASDFLQALDQLYYRLPWLVIPMSLAALKKPKTSMVHLILGFFIFLITISGLVVLINYFSNYTYYTAQIALAKHIPTPLNHIRYSLMVAFAGLASFYFFVKGHTKLSPFDQKFFGITGVFLFILIHILSVRSGLMSYYLGLLFLLVFFAFYYRKYWILPLFGLGLLAMPFIAYQVLPSFQNKVDYMRYDIQQFGQGHIGHNSDGRRWRSLLMAKELIVGKPLLGYGIGQVTMVSKEYYNKFYPSTEPQNQKVPHNQFLYTTVEMGVLGLLALLTIVIAPLLFNPIRKNPLYLILWIIVLSSCLVENTFESQIGMSFYLLISSLLLKQGTDA